MDPNQKNPLGQVPPTPAQNTGVPQLTTQPSMNPAQAPAPGQLPNNGFPPGHNPYEFITNPRELPKKKTLFAPGSLRSRILIILGAGVLVTIAIIVLSSVLTSKRTANLENLRGLVAQQQEIIRVSAIGTANAKDATTKNFTQTTTDSVTSEQIQLNSFLVSKKIKITPLQLNAKKDAQTDLALETAKQASTFDSTVTTILLGLLTTYANDTAEAYKAATTPAAKAILETSFNSSSALVKGYSSPQPATPTP